LIYPASHFANSRSSLRKIFLHGKLRIRDTWPRFLIAATKASRQVELSSAHAGFLFDQQRRMQRDNDEEWNFQTKGCNGGFAAGKTLTTRAASVHAVSFIRRRALRLS
jgi:hypothetical protein